MNFNHGLGSFFSLFVAFHSLHAHQFLEILRLILSLFTFHPMITIDLTDPRISTFILSITFFNTITEILYCLMYCMVLLTICYVHQANCRKPSHLSFDENFEVYLFLTCAQLIGKIYGKELHCFYDGKQFRSQIRDPLMKYFLLCDMEVHYDDYNEFKQDKDLYQFFYTNIRFYYRSPRENISTEKYFPFELDDIPIGKNTNQVRIESIDHHDEFFIWILRIS